MSRLVAFEEHGEVLAHWHGQGWRDEVVVVFDHHLDLKRIGTGALERLRQAHAAGSGLGALNRDAPFHGDDRFAYGLDDFLYAAAHVGLLRHVVWVAPDHVAGTPAQRRALLWDRLSLIPGHGEESMRCLEASEHAISSRVGPLRIQLTSLAGLRSLPLPSGARLDLDLDFFYDERRGQTHELEEVVEVLRARRLLEEPPAATFSIHSGFMPEAYRWLGEALARRLGLALEPTRPRAAVAPLTLRSLSSHGPPTPAELEGCEAELSRLGASGWALRALLALRLERLTDAQGCYERAVTAGDRASWAAYGIGLRLMERKDHREAAAWLARAQHEHVDTIEVHALVLQAICELRSGHWEHGEALAARASALAPMRREPYLVASAAAKRRGDRDGIERARRGLDRIDELREGRGLANGGDACR